MFSTNPPNPFRQHEVSYDTPPRPARLQLSDDDSRTILSRNDSPDLGFRWSLNPYRGCTHACAYCYARAFHEHLDMGAGEDFDRKLRVKRDAARLLERALRKDAWRGEVIALSGGTDAWQPVERDLRITRACVQVAVRYRQPLTIITRSPLIARDVDLLATLARHAAVAVSFSVPILDPDICRALEPGAALPEARFTAMKILADAGVPVGLSLCPIIPGVNEHHIPQTLRRARRAGADWAFMQSVRLAPSVRAVFEDRLRTRLPSKAAGVLARLARAGIGTGPRGSSGTPEASGDATRQLFRLWHTRLGYTAAPMLDAPSPFRVPGAASQVSLFGYAAPPKPVHAG